jgi:hypothetical protein
MSNSVIVHACRGEDVADSLRELDALVREANEPELLNASLDASANAALSSGRLTDARRAWWAMVSETPSLGPWAYYQSGRCALWATDLDGLREDRAAFDASGYHGQVVDLRRTTMDAGIAALAGRTADAQRMYADAVKGWHDVGLPWDEALTGIDMATVLDPADAKVQAVGASAREILERLRARPFIERLDAALGRSIGTPAATVASEPVAVESA